MPRPTQAQMERKLPIYRSTSGNLTILLTVPFIHITLRLLHEPFLRPSLRHSVVVFKALSKLCLRTAFSFVYFRSPWPH